MQYQIKYYRSGIRALWFKDATWSGSAGSEVGLPVSTMARGESRERQGQAELLAHGPPAQLSDTWVSLGELGTFRLRWWIKKVERLF